MSEVDTERVFMLWPSTLKQRVRDVVGSRGLSAFVIDAVEAKLAAEPETGDDPEPAGDELEGADSTDVEQSTPASPTAQQERVEQIRAKFDLMRASELPHSTRISRAVTGQDEHNVEHNVDNNVDHKVGDTVEVGGIGFTKISDDPFGGIDTPLANAMREDEQVSPPGPAAPTADVEPEPASEVIDNILCPQCQAPLIDGECWACDM